MPTATTPSSAKGRGKNGKSTNGNGAGLAQAVQTDVETAGASRQSITSEQIARRAYELYEQEGRQDGKDVEYWLRAEAELRGGGENG